MTVVKVLTKRFSFVVYFFRGSWRTLPSRLPSSSPNGGCGSTVVCFRPHRVVTNDFGEGRGYERTTYHNRHRWGLISMTDTSLYPDTTPSSRTFRFTTLRPSRTQSNLPRRPRDSQDKRPSRSRPSYVQLKVDLGSNVLSVFP